ncbi:MAG: hypothetical protein MUC35_05290 [Candidatus Margulisbacteria bacterium]|jgi:hypothetical protein|nr:hypothetical protein [Candidatus Margulisiibacteriota bacterium]
MPTSINYTHLSAITTGMLRITYLGCEQREVVRAMVRAVPTEGRNLAVAKLSSLARNDSYLGLLTFRQWHTELTTFFEQYRQEQPRFRAYFPSLDDYFTLPSVGAADKLRLNFSVDFISKTARKHGPVEEIQFRLAALTFLNLLDLAAKIKERQRTGQPITDLLDKANQAFAQTADPAMQFFVHDYI